jgi:DNA-binding transcriptional ArsR family regulator
MGDLQQLIGALHSPVRRRILALIWDRELPAGEIAAAFDITPSTVSQHLSVLRDAELVTMTVRANFRLYRARQDVLRSLHGALSGTSPKWTPADDVPERALARAETHPVVIAQVEVDLDQPTTFTAFTDPAVYSHWMGVPVTIVDGRFSCTLEWGTRVEGVYERVDPPHLIALRWNVEDGNVPIPGGDLIGYLRFAAIDGGCHVEVHQLVDTPEQAEYMTAAWTMVLGRLKSGVVAASRGGERTRRARRPKTTGSTSA